MKYVSVILDDNIKKPLDYSIPKELLNSVKEGQRVEVPLRGQKRKGFIFKIKSKTNIKTVKPISNILSNEKIPKNLFILASWISQYYLCPLSKVLKYMIPKSVREQIEPKQLIFLSLKKSKKESLKKIPLLSKYPLQSQILELFLQAKKGFFLKDLLKITNTSKSPIDSLIKKNLLKEEKLLDEDTVLLNSKYFPTKAKSLTKEQKKAFDTIILSVKKKEFKIHLLHGITGSGKTEIYLQAIDKTLKLNKTCIVLFPEIAITSQLIERFKSRFSQKIALIHHKRSQGEKQNMWKDISQEKIHLILGTRSAIFAPAKNIGLIIVDEEHDSSYKQTDDIPTYSGKNVAIMRASFAKCPIILGSATPSLESFHLAEKNVYKLSSLTKRPDNSSIPKVHIIDMKKEFEKTKCFTHFSDALLSKIKDRYQKGEQTLLFLNKRGYHTLLFCPNCSFIKKCPNCDLSLTYHKKENVLSCHACLYKTNPQKNCPICKKPSLQYRGFGTQHVEASIKAIFPYIRTLRLDKDTTTTKDSHSTILKEFKAGKADILIGTQMIVKGLHFPSVTLVGVLNTDYSMNIPDFRSQETVFQLITQVSGRSGREGLKGEVVIQTFMPNNPIIKLAAKQDYLSFYEEEIKNRKTFGYPPFTKILKITFFGKEELYTQKIAKNFRIALIKKLPSHAIIHPVIPSFLKKHKNFYRFNFLIRSKKISDIYKPLEKLIKDFKIPSSIKMLLDIDPLSTL